MSKYTDDGIELMLRQNISKSITFLLEKNSMTQTDLAEILDVDNSTIGKWINQKAIPRMGIIQKIADYFHVEKSFILDYQNKNLIAESREPYYLNEETRIIAQEIFDSPELKMLFDASRKAKPEDLKFVTEMFKRMNRDENQE